MNIPWDFPFLQRVLTDMKSTSSIEDPNSTTVNETNHKPVLLNELTAEQLIQLLLHCKLSPSVILSIKKQQVNGADLLRSVRSEQDLVDIGIKVLPARALYNRIIEWKDSGLPEDFIVVLAPTQTPPPPSTPSPPSVEDRKQTYKSYYEARFCGSEDSFHLILQQSEAGNQLAEAYLGALYAFGCQAAVKDAEKALLHMAKVKDFLRAEADKGCPFPQQIYAFALAYGIGVAKNQLEAVRYYKLAAEQGHANAQVALAVAYAAGRGVKQNRRKAIQYYKRAANQGHALAQCSLGWCYTLGSGVRKNVNKAAMLYKLAADLGNADAQCNIAVCYQKGTGVAQDLQESARYYKLSADQTNFYAQNNLGVLYANGMGVVKDQQEAVRYYKLAADQGYSVAQYNLATCYAKGNGVALDAAEAERYFKLAAEQGGVKEQGVKCTACCG